MGAARSRKWQLTINNPAEHGADHKTLKRALEELKGLVFDNVYLLPFFIHLKTIYVAIPIVIALVNAEHIYRFCMWLIKKVPALNIH